MRRWLRRKESKMEEKLNAGAEVWVVTRDEDGIACGVSGYMFLAEVAGYVIATSYINDLTCLDSTLAYHAQETVENYDTDLAVFPAEDCWPTREAAHAALAEEKGERDE